MAFTTQELWDMMYLYGETGGNGRAVERLYPECFPNRRRQSYQMIMDTVFRLRERGSLHPRYEDSPISASVICKMNSQHSFNLTSTHKSFNDKQKDLFNELDKVSVTLPQHIVNDVPDDNDNDKTFDPPSLKRLRGKESIFKRPETVPKRRLSRFRTPHFQRYPHKWTKYSLDDVKDEDMSETGNRKAALTFLKELESRNVTDAAGAMDTLPDKITFQKSKLVSDTNDVIPTQTFRNSKVVMPEYVVGQKIKKERKNKERSNISTSKELKLTHLLDEDDAN
ncbi:tumor suppressing subtransferable candidate 4 tssc4 [Holotrichia oblita]|uniref:Tumor suppressing subtransferable candidate 4 tssc4 n=1 Tax=Holotrichia oblita TaxID=644536 RepID=A0ACB9TWF7_HOLOL|nr:tumor suppressing subtransferable candidate 4 tssc4 [Holotrichia oblita]